MRTVPLCDKSDSATADSAETQSCHLQLFRRQMPVARASETHSPECQGQTTEPVQSAAPPGSRRTGCRQTCFGVDAMTEITGGELVEGEFVEDGTLGGGQGTSN